jgi:DNA-binding XRE family transcriptional regulator
VPTITLSNVRRTIDTCGVQVVTLAKVYGIAPSTLSSGFADKSYLGSTKEAELLTLANQIARVVEALKPLELPRNGVQAAETLRFLLTRPLDELAMQVSKIFERGE